MLSERWLWCSITFRLHVFTHSKTLYIAYGSLLFRSICHSLGWTKVACSHSNALYRWRHLSELYQLCAVSKTNENFIYADRQPYALTHRQHRDHIFLMISCLWQLNAKLKIIDFLFAGLIVFTSTLCVCESVLLSMSYTIWFHPFTYSVYINGTMTK